MDFFTIRVMCCNFLNLYGRYVLQYKSFLKIFSLQTQQIEVRLVAIKSAYFSTKPIPPFIFSRTFPLSENFSSLRLTVASTHSCIIRASTHVRYVYAFDQSYCQVRLHSVEFTQHDLDNTWRLARSQWFRQHMKIGKITVI